MGRCWPLQLPAVEKSVLISLADQANDQGVCWPSIQTICNRTCYAERAVQKALRSLEARGLLNVEIGAMRANRYTLRPDRYKPETPEQNGQNDGQTPAPHAPPHHVHPRTTCTPPPHHVHPNRNRTVSNTPPIPPKGGNPCPGENQNPEPPGYQATPVKAKAARGPAPVIALAAWLEQCKAAGVKPIPPDDPIWAYCERVGITEDMLVLHLGEFKRRHIASGKRQADWRRKLRLSVEGNWYRLWWIGADNTCSLSTQGRQAQMAQAPPACQQAATNANARQATSQPNSHPATAPA